MAIIKLTRNDNPLNPTINKYTVKYNGRTIGSVERFESNQWGAKPNWKGIHMISDSRNRKTAVDRLIAVHLAR